MSRKETNQNQPQKNRNFGKVNVNHNGNIYFK
jgi:hypothetical protein